MGPRSRASAVLGRWADVCLTGIIGAGAFLLLSPYLGSLHAALHPQTTLHPVVFLIAVLCVVGPLLLYAGRRRWLACFGVRHFFARPPAWVGGVLGAGVVLLTEAAIGRRSPSDGRLFVQGAAGLLLAVMGLNLAVRGLGFIAQRIKRRRRNTGSWACQQEANGASLGQIVAWFMTDAEVEHPADDRFRHDDIARRIVRRLSDPREGAEAPTTAVVGPLGSGKSTIGRLVEFHASTLKNVEVIPVSLWPFESTDAAVRGILAALVRGLGRQVGLLGLSGLADQYVSSIERVGGRWGSFARLLTAPDQPAEVLKRVEAVARAINVRYVLWIEDLERFALDAGHRREVMAADSARLGPIRALLYLLDRCERISVIVADCSLDSRFDLDKVARFIERVPSLSAEEVRTTFRTYRDACLQEADGIIDPVEPKRRKDFLGDGGPLLRGIVADDPARMVLETALSLLLATPRALKTALRVSHEVWQRLAGEIDLDDVLMMCAIRAARPQVFAFIDQHIERFRDGFRWRKILRDEDPKDHPVYQDFEKLMNEEPTDPERAAVRTLVRCVFPALPSESGSIPADRLYLDRPQGLASKHHVDYWRRYLSIPDISEQQSDQAALTAILAWKKRERNDLVERVIDGNRSDQIESFVNSFEGNELCRLLEEVATAVSAQSPASWGKRGYAPGMISLRRMMQNKPPDPEVLASTISELIARVVPFHLPLVNELVYWFGSPDRGAIIDILGDEGRKLLERALRGALSSSFGPGDGRKLLAACQKGGPLVLRWLSHHLEQRDSDKEGGQPFDGWSKLADVMLEAAEKHPAEGVPYLIPFVSGAMLGWKETEGGTLQAWIGTFDEDAARRLFDFDRLLPLLADTPVPDDFEPGFLAGWSVAQRDARRIQQV